MVGDSVGTRVGRDGVGGAMRSAELRVLSAVPVFARPQTETLLATCVLSLRSQEVRDPSYGGPADDPIKVALSGASRRAVGVEPAVLGWRVPSLSPFFRVLSSFVFPRTEKRGRTVAPIRLRVRR